MSTNTTPSKQPKNRREFCNLRDGRKLSYFVQGEPQDANDSKDSTTTSSSSSLPHIFMFHGMFGTASDVLFRSLPNKYVWVCVDRAGYGHSSPPPPPTETYSYRQFATDIGELADHLQVAKFYVVGHSSGGPCALACGAHLGDRVLGIGAIASDAEYVAVEAPKEGSCEKCCLRCFLPCCIFGLSCGDTCGPCSRRLDGYKVDHMLEHEAYDFRIGSIRQPTLLVYGADDTWATPHSEFIQDRIEGAETMVLPTANHGSIVQKVHVDAIITKLLSMTKSGDF